MDYLKIERLSFSETIGQAFKLYADNFTFLFFVSLIGSTPFILIPELADFNPMAENQASFGSVILRVFIIFILNSITLAVMTDHIAQRYMNRNRAGDEYAFHILALLGSILGLSIVVGLLVSFGFLMFILPGIYFALTLSLSNISLVIERHNIMDCMRRSMFLTYGRKLEITGYMLVVIVITLGAIIFSNTILYLTGPLKLSPGIKILFLFLVQVLISPINATIFFQVYLNIRIDKEQFTLDKWKNQTLGTKIPE